ncbi:hypothetical protein F4677DRAFT_401455 [Hypoxylon crocopeplum]|nr:hypothetical protein F4677DRAFT_401455 [Hypoxylon crocopeplum]
MADEIRQTPVPVPHVYGQPATATESPTPASAPALAAEMPDAPIDGAVTPPGGGGASLRGPSFEQALSPGTTATFAALSPVTTAATMVALAPAPSSAPSPAASASTSTALPARTGTPLRTTNGSGQDGSSRAASQHPDPGLTMPAEAPPHGAPIRQYLNGRVTGPLMEGMKLIAKERPKDPLRVLGEYLIQCSKELEASSA